MALMTIIGTICIISLGIMWAFGIDKADREDVTDDGWLDDEKLN